MIFKEFTIHYPSKGLVIFMNANCYTKIEVENKKDYYLIEEVGDLCRCQCAKIITIPNAPTKNIVHKVGIYEKSIDIIDFCGISTFGKCKTDSDCITSGCSGEVCQSKYESETYTPCIIKDCYDT